MLSVLQLDHAVIPFFARCQDNGVPVDRAGMLSLAREMQARKEELLETLQQKTGYYLNPNSDDQVRTLLKELLPASELEGLTLTDGGEISTGKKVIEALRGLHPPIDDVIEYRQCTKVETTYAMPMALEKDPPPPAEPNRARSNLRITRVASGRLSAGKRDEGGASLLTIPTHSTLGRRVRKQCKVQVPGRVLLARDLCLAPGTRVLTADLRWVAIEMLQPGQRVIGCDEFTTGGHRRLRTAIVEHAKQRRAICYEIDMTDGRRLVASEEHPWLARTPGTAYPHKIFRWIKTKDLRVGQEFCKLAAPWEDDNSREAGWLAGVFDGEGSLDKRSGTLTFTQRLNSVFTTAYDALQERGYRFHFPGFKKGGFPGSGDTIQMWTSGIADCMHFVGSIRPLRLLEGIEALWEGKNLRPCRHEKGSIGDSRPTAIAAIREIGEQDVVSLQTSTSTFVAEGFITHNSQIEFRVCAHVSQDRAMCDIFLRDQDLHSQTASRIFGLPEDQLDKKHRHPAKTAGFGILYGITAVGLRDQMRIAGVGDEWPEDRCQELLDDWFKVFPGVRAYISMTRARAAKLGYVKAMSGRRRYLPGAASPLSWVREEAYRQAVSLEIQGTAQDILKQGMAELWPLLVHHWRTERTYLEPLLQVHDELLWEIDEQEAENWSAVCDAAMTTTTQLRVPIKSSGGTATDWGSLEK